MSPQLEFDAFLTSLYKDSHLKNRITMWTFVALVLPTSLLLALDVPAKPLYISLCVLLLPLQFLVYRFSGRKHSTKELKQHSEGIYSATLNDINYASWAELLTGGNQIGSAKLQVYIDTSGLLTWEDALQGSPDFSTRCLLLPLDSRDPLLQAMMGKAIPEDERISTTRLVPRQAGMPQPFLSMLRPTVVQ